jgi:fibronectin type 3 domain-containing protein
MHLLFGLIMLLIAAQANAACDRNATTSTFSTELAAATTGQTICLAAGNYGTFTGTNKAVTIQCNSGATCNMAVDFGSGDTGFTIDGMSGVNGQTTGTASNITIKNSTFNGAMEVLGTGAGILLDGNNHKNICGNQSSWRVLFEGPGTIQNSLLEGCGSDGVRLGGTAVANVLNNTFLNIIDDGSGNHTDNIQFYGGSNAVVRGNYFKQTIQGETQVIGAFDGTSGNLIEDNVIDVISRPWGIELYKDTNSIVRHNTVVYHTVAEGCFYNINCGGITLDTKDTPGSGTQIYDNIAVFLSFENGSTASVNNKNMLRSGATGTNFNGIPVFVGGSNPTTYGGYALAVGSPGKAAASDGLDVGARISAPVDTAPPTTPTGLTALATGATQVNLSWTASTDDVAVTGYDIRRCSGAGCTPSTIIASTVGTGTTYSNTGLTASTVYRYDVRSKDGVGNTSSYSSIAQATTSAPATYTATPSERLNHNGGVINPSSAQSITEGNTTTFSITPSGGYTALASGTCGGSLSGTTYTTNAITANCTVVADYIASICALQPASTATTAMSAQTGTFTYRFSVIPVATTHDLTLGHTNGAWSAYTSYATTVRFSSAGVVDVRNGAAYSGTYAYSANHQYDVRMVVNVAAKTYSVYISDNGGAETQVASNYAFRSDQSTVSTLNNFVAVTLSGSTTGSYYCPTGLDSTDTTPPTATITAPTNGSSVQGSSVAVSATATDNVGVVGVQFKLDGSNLGSEDTTSPYSVTWNTTTGSDGAHSLTATSRDNATNSTTSSAVSVTVDNNAPSVPSGLSGSPVGGSQANLTWTASSDTVGVTGYDVARCTGAWCTPTTVVGTPTTNSYSNTGLSDVTEYRYAVRAKDAIGNASSYSTVSTVTTLDGTAPSTPTAPTATAVSTSQINLSWTASTDNVGVSTYSVERCTGAACSSFAALVTQAGTTYNNTGLSSGTTYRYRVRATDAAGNNSAYSAIFEATTVGIDSTPPTIPIGVSATAVSDSQINISWNASTDAVGVTGYRVDRCAGVSCTSFALLVNQAGTTYSDTGLSPATAYRYRVLAYDAAGNNSSYSSYFGATTNSADITPPVVTITEPDVLLPRGTTSATISATTNEASTCKYASQSGVSFAAKSAFSSTGSTSHSTSIAVKDGGVYHRWVACQDAYGNVSADKQVDFSVTTGKRKRGRM